MKWFSDLCQQSYQLVNDKYIFKKQYLKKHTQVEITQTTM